MKPTNLTPAEVLLIILIMLSVFTSKSQNVVKLADGNYSAIKREYRQSEAKPTGQTYTDSKGVKYPVLISKNGKLYVIRTSAKGNKYNYYLSETKKQ